MLAAGGTGIDEATAVDDTVAAALVCQCRLRQRMAPQQSSAGEQQRPPCKQVELLLLRLQLRLHLLPLLV